MKNKMKEYRVPFAYERYGHVVVEAQSEEEAFSKAEKLIENMKPSELDALSEYLPDSEEIDREGVIKEV